MFNIFYCEGRDENIEFLNGHVGVKFLFVAIYTIVIQLLEL